MSLRLGCCFGVRVGLVMWLVGLSFFSFGEGSGVFFSNLLETV